MSTFTAHRTARGFTLLEVMLAIVLLALLLAGTWGAIETSLENTLLNHIRKVPEVEILIRASARISLRLRMPPAAVIGR